MNPLTSSIPSTRDPAGMLPMLAQALLALRSTRDLGAAGAIVGSCIVNALEATDYRLLRVDARSGALRCLDGCGVETPYLAEPDGAVHRVLQGVEPLYLGPDDLEKVSPEPGLWIGPPASLIVLPLQSGSRVLGLLLVGFDLPTDVDAVGRQFLQTLSDGLALAFERAELRQRGAEDHRRVLELEHRRAEGEEISSNLMAIVADEIRTPLTAIKAYTEAMIEHLSNPHAPRERFLGIISDECDRLQRLVGDVLDLSKLEAGQRPLRLARTSLESLVREVADQHSAEARGRHVGIETKADDGLVVECDPDLVRRMLSNLVAHAIKFSPTGSTVRIAASARGDDWIATVEDDGTPLPPEELPYAFERFYRGRPGVEQGKEGSGLGLAIARGVAELHGGRVWAQSRGARGVRSCVQLPVRQVASPRARRIARQTWSRSDLRELFHRTVDLVAASMSAEIVSFMLVDAEKGDLFIAASRGLEGQNLLGRRTTLRSGVAGAVAALGRPLLVSNIETDRRFSRLNHPQYRTKSLLCVPVRVDGEVLGVLNVNNKSTGECFDEDDLAVLSALVERIGSAVERALAHPDSERVVAEAIAAVENVTRLQREHLLEIRDAVHLARATARELNMLEPDVDLIGYVASIHDLGMTSLKSRVARPEPLDEEGQREVRQHPQVSVEILRPLEYLSSVRDITLAHHERWDGTGYPHGAAGADIPIGGRILAVVDAFLSMTSGRPYRSARSREEAVGELRHEAGRQFDPEVVEAFLRALEREAEAA